MRGLLVYVADLIAAAWRSSVFGGLSEGWQIFWASILFTVGVSLVGLLCKASWPTVRRNILVPLRRLRTRAVDRLTLGYYWLTGGSRHPIRARWESKHTWDKRNLRLDLVIDYTGPRGGKTKVRPPQASLTIEATEHSGITQGGSDRPRATVKGNAGAWGEALVVDATGQRGSVSFDLSRGQAAGIASAPHHKITLNAQVHYSGPAGSGVVEAEPKEIRS